MWQHCQVRDGEELQLTLRLQLLIFVSLIFFSAAIVSWYVSYQNIFPSLTNFMFLSR